MSIYVPYHKLGTTENIIVDGAANEYTKLTLSHWPGVNLNPALKDDLSAQIVFKYLADPSLHVPIEVEAISNNHFDEDGLMGLWTLMEPEEALERQEAVIDIASAGDFGTYTDRDSAKVSFVIRAWMDPELSPLNKWVFEQPYLEQCAILYEELLPRIDKIIDRISAFSAYWRKQDDLLEKGEEMVRKGEIKIIEKPDIDLAIVTLPEPKKKDKERELSLPWKELVQEMAIHNQTGMMRILLRQANRYALYYRYETWVEYASRKLMPRLELKDFCSTLNGYEKHGASWRSDDIQTLTPYLSFSGALESDIPFEGFVEELRQFLSTQALLQTPEQKPIYPH